MAQKPFERVIINARERPLSSDIDDLESRADRTLRDVLRHMLAKRQITGNLDGFTPATGFLGDGFKADPTGPASMAVNLRVGFGFLDNTNDTPQSLGAPPVVGLDDLSPFKPLVLTAAQLVNIDPVPPAGQTRIDLIEVAYDRQITDQAIRGILDPNLGQFVGTSVFKTLGFTLDGLVGRVVDPANSVAPIGYKVGTPFASGGFGPNSAGPAVSPGYKAVAEIIVHDTTVTITRDLIRDKRTMLFPAKHGRVLAHVQLDPGDTVGAPTLLEVIAPPGVFVTAVEKNDGTNPLHHKGPIDLYIVPGAKPATFGAQARVNAPAIPSSANANQVNGFVMNTLLQSIKADVAQQNATNGARSASAFQVAIGQDVLIVTVEAMQLSVIGGGAVAGLALPNPVDYLIEVDLGY